MSVVSLGISSMERDVIEGDNPVFDLDCAAYDCRSKSRVLWDWSSKWVVVCHLKLNTDERPIANKYREGKMKRTLKRELKSA